MSFASLLCVRCASAPIGWFFWNFRTEFEPHWDFLEAWRRGWLPRNVSDFAAFDKLRVCEEGAPPVAPTTTHIITHHGIYGGVVEQPWIARNWLPLVVGALGGGVVALAAMHLAAIARRSQPSEAEPTPYVAMPQSSAS